MHEVDFGSRVPIDDVSAIKFRAPKIFGSGLLAAGLLLPQQIQPTNTAGMKSYTQHPGCTDNKSSLGYWYVQGIVIFRFFVRTGIRVTSNKCVQISL